MSALTALASSDVSHLTMPCSPDHGSGVSAASNQRSSMLLAAITTVLLSLGYRPAHAILLALRILTALALF